MINTKTFYDVGLGEYMYLGVLKNRTLYIDQFTDESQKSEKNLECLIPKSLDDVFACFQPGKEKVALKREDGSAVLEKFIFQHLSDFDDDQLISQSDTLKTLNDRKDMSTIAVQCLKENLCSIHEEIKVIETAYRTLSLFFDNASPELDGSLSIMNVKSEGLCSSDSDETLSISKELERRNDSLSCKGRYGLLVIPGYLGEASVVSMWAVIAHKYRTLLISDFMDSPDYDTLITELRKAKLQDSDVFLANAVMTCNYITASYKNDDNGNCNKLYLPASAALAGRLANTDAIISEGISDIEHGKLKSVNNTRINISETDAAALTEMGLIVVTHQNDSVFPVSNRTLYSGCMEFLKEYPLARTASWIRESIEYVIQQSVCCFNMSRRAINDLKQSIQDYLNEFKGSYEIIEDYNLERVEADPKARNILVVVSLKFHNVLRPVRIEISGEYFMGWGYKFK